jgi:glutamate-1-semialdehyde aminotransferase
MLVLHDPAPSRVAVVTTDAAFLAGYRSVAMDTTAVRPTDEVLAAAFDAGVQAAKSDDI